MAVVAETRDRTRTVAGVIGRAYLIFYPTGDKIALIYQYLKQNETSRVEKNPLSMDDR